MPKSIIDMHDPLARCGSEAFACGIECDQDHGRSFGRPPYFLCARDVNEVNFVITCSNGNPFMQGTKGRSSHNAIEIAPGQFPTGVSTKQVQRLTPGRREQLSVAADSDCRLYACVFYRRDFV